MPQPNLIPRYPSGNRNSTGYTTGTDNQMTAAPNLAATTSHFEFAYDHEGNTTDGWTKTGTASTEHVVYTWDFRNRLAETQTYTVWWCEPTPGWFLEIPVSAARRTFVRIPRRRAPQIQSIGGAHRSTGIRSVAVSTNKR